MREKDEQFYSLIRSDDINISNSLEAFTRESESFFVRQRLSQLRKEWADSKNHNTADLNEYFRNSPLMSNPVCADILMLHNDKVVASAAGHDSVEFLTETDADSLRLCTDGTGQYFLGYEAKATNNVTYEALVDLRALYINTLGQNTIRDLILLDSSSSVIIYKYGTEVRMTAADADADKNTVTCRDYLIDCEQSQRMEGTSIELKDNAGESKTARMVVIPSGSTVNREFAIGLTADYEEAIGPSRNAAEKMLIYGGVAVLGVLMLIFTLLFQRRANTMTATELRILKRKNAEMEELNQNMQALAHHQRLETIGTMTASIAHDFNNLLTPIMGYSMMTMEMIPDDMEDIQENLMEIYNASVKAKDLVTRLADMSKKGREEEFTDLSPDEIIRNSLKVTRPAKPKNVEVRGNLHAGRARMKGDSTQITQLVTNLVLNAYDAMRERGGTLFVSAGVEDGRIVMRFRDTGTGMDAETMARIFDPFYTTKESGKGTGLGLAIVAQIAETHGGKVYVDSTPGEGTEFRVTFPISEQTEVVDKTKTIKINAEEFRNMLRNEEQELKKG